MQQKSASDPFHYVEFKDHPLGFYNRTVNDTLDTAFLTDTLIITTNGDIEEYGVIVRGNVLNDYCTVTIDAVNKQLISAEAMRKTKHLILIQGWEMAGLLKRIHTDCFEISIGGGERLWTRSFGLGEPL